MTVIVVLWLIGMAEIDRRTLRLPNILLYPALIGAAVTGLLVPLAGLAGVAAALPYTVAFALRSCGGGDVKLAAVCGVLLGDPIRALFAVVTAALMSLALLLGPARRARSEGSSSVGGGRSSAVCPHGPALAAATLACLIVGAG